MKLAISLVKSYHIISQGSDLEKWFAT